MEETEILYKTIRWINSEKEVRLALMTGSFAERSITDELSDNDISLFCVDTLLRKIN